MPDDPLNMIDRARAAQPAFIEVHIRYHLATGQVVQVDGPLDNPALVFGILELARECIYVHRAATIKRETAAIVQGPGILKG